MNPHDAINLIEKAVADTHGAWADLGAGDGTFTEALLPLLGPGSRIYAVDHEPNAVKALTKLAASSAGKVVSIAADFTRVRELSALIELPLDGILLANSLHFVRDHAHVLAQLTELLRPGGRVVLVEYDRSTASQWVPFPIPLSDLPALATAAGLGDFVVTATRPSAYQGIIYVAAAERSDDDA